MNNNDLENTKKNENKKKKIVLAIVINLLLIVGVLGITFAFFTYSEESSNQQLIAGDIYIRFNQGTSINVNNTEPSSTEPSNFFDFTVTGKNTSTDTIVYDINLLRGDLISGKTESQRIADKFLKFTLKRSIDGTNYTDVVTRQSYADLSNGVRIYVDNVGTTNSVITYYYKLYVWVTDEIVIGGGDYIGDYQDTEWGGMFATVKVKVTGDFASKTVDRTLSDVVASKVSQSYVSQYSGSSNDTYNGRGNKTIYYFTGNDAKANSNVLFAGYCWQMIRTTDNGGIKLLYNGVAENNQCLENRTAKRGINGGGNSNITGLDSTSVYGTGFTYTTSGFTLTGVVDNKNWATDYNDLIGMYTCKGTNLSCGTIYQIVRYDSPSSAKGASYSISGTGGVADKYTIGTSPFSGAYETPAYVGYMFNKAYMWTEGTKDGNNTYGGDVTYSNGHYSLVSTVSQSVPDQTHHYICDDDDCEKVRYYIILYNEVYRYIVLENGETVDDALHNMVNYKVSESQSDVNLNVHNSSIKAYLDSWYSQNLSSYANYLDTSVTYCNERKVTSLGGWNKGGRLDYWLYFTNSTADRTDLSCPNELDRFSVENNKAKLTYPIGLITEPESALMNGAAGDGVEGKYVWGLSPLGFDRNYGAYVRMVASSGAADGYYVSYAFGVRPAVSLSPVASFAEGDGTYASPYVVGDKLTRTIS